MKQIDQHFSHTRTPNLQLLYGDTAVVVIGSVRSFLSEVYAFTPVSSIFGELICPCL